MLPLGGIRLWAGPGGIPGTSLGGRGTPPGQWPGLLATRGWRGERVALLQQLFEEIHLLEFAPELSDIDALRHDVERRSRELSRRLP